MSLPIRVFAVEWRLVARYAVSMLVLMGGLVLMVAVRAQELRVIHFAPQNGELAHYARDLRNGMQRILMPSMEAVALMEM